MDTSEAILIAFIVILSFFFLIFIFARCIMSIFIQLHGERDSNPMDYETLHFANLKTRDEYKKNV